MKDCRPRFPKPVAKALENRSESDNEPLWQTVVKESEGVQKELEELSRKEKEERKQSVADIFNKKDSKEPDDELDKILEVI